MLPNQPTSPSDPAAAAARENLTGSPTEQPAVGSGGAAATASSVSLMDAVFGATDRNVATALDLLLDALVCLNTGRLEESAWRVADALGVISQECGSDPGTIGIDTFTGRGFRLQSRPAPTIGGTPSPPERSALGVGETPRGAPAAGAESQGATKFTARTYRMAAQNWKPVAPTASEPFGDPGSPTTVALLEQAAETLESHAALLAACRDQADLIRVLWGFMKTGENEFQIRRIIASLAKSDAALALATGGGA